MKKKIQKNPKKIQKKSGKPSLFQHIGTHSSLKGKIQKLTDKQFVNIRLFTPHQNPPATFETKINYHQQYSLARAYKGETFFWAVSPQLGDFIRFKFNQPIDLSYFKFVSGNAEHPSDKFKDTTIQIRPNDSNANLTHINLQTNSEGYHVVGHFDKNGLAEGEIDVKSIGKIRELQLVVGKSHENWAILSEMYFRTNKE